MGNKILITGLPGCGKSTLVKEIVNELGVRAGGIVTPEIRESGIRKGFRIIDMASKKEGILSHISLPAPRIGKYGVNLKDLEGIGVKAIRDALKNPEITLVVMDEVGAMEMISEKFRNAVEDALSSDKDCLIVLHRNFVKRYRDRGKLFFLTKENRDEVKRGVVGILTGRGQHNIGM